MLIPRYFFIDDFKSFYPYLLTKPHKRKKFIKGDFLWEPNKLIEKIHYIIFGIAQNYVEHERGYKKIISFHGKGTIFPGYHEYGYKIENSIITKAMTDMEVLEFTKNDFSLILKDNKKLMSNLINWYSMYVNLLLYENAHQEYNSSFIKLCNLLYLLLIHEQRENFINITQNDIADILGISRMNLVRSLTQLREEKIIVTQRKHIEIINPKALIKYCSLETL